MCWEGSDVVPIDHLQNVINPPADQAVVDETFITLANPKLAAVFKLQTFFKCLRCGSRTEPAKDIDNEVRCCNQECGILNNSTYCEKFSSAEVLMIAQKRKVTLTAFGETIGELLGSSTVTPAQIQKTTKL